MSFLEKLHSGVILLADGAMGTELQRRGMSGGECPEEYNITHPEIVQAIYRDYYNAGSDLVETNTFGANQSRLAIHGCQKRVVEFCRASAQLARAVCPPGKFIAGSIGPTGSILAPAGSCKIQDAYEYFAEQAVALFEGEADVIFIETMMNPEEAALAIHAAKDHTPLPVVATMSFESSDTGLRTMWGTDVPTAVERLTDAGADVIGANCGRGFDEMVTIIAEMRPLTNLPIIAQPNAGMPEWIDDVPRYKEAPELILPRAEKLLQLGVNILGGCCGTGPEHVRVMRKAVDTFMAQSR